MPGIECQVEFPNGRFYSFSDVLKRFTHHRGFDLTSSYCIIECEHPSIDAMTEFMNFTALKFRYGRDDKFIPDTLMEIFSIDNEILSPGIVRSKIVAFEPGFIRLQETSKIKSYPNTTVSNVLSQMASDAGLKTSSITTTSGQYTYVQPNMTDVDFIMQYLLPVATDAAGSTPMLFTIDSGKMILKPPKLTGKPTKKFVLDPSKDNNIKHVVFRNRGLSKDVAFGNTYLTYSYDFREKGMLEHESKLESVVDSKLSKKTYQSEFFRTEVMPYDEEWMLKAHNRNVLGRAQFVVAVDAAIEGSPFYDFDTNIQIEIPLSLETNKGEYSGFYYVYHMAAQLEPRSFVTRMNLRSNAFYHREQLRSKNSNFGSQLGADQSQITRGSASVTDTQEFAPGE